VEYCARCHSFAIPAIGHYSGPDSQSVLGSVEAFNGIVLQGVLASAGMAKFNDLLSEGDVLAIQGYLTDEAWKAYETERLDGHSARQ
jgi:hypothetical protein